MYKEGKEYFIYQEAKGLSEPTSVSSKQQRKSLKCQTELKYNKKCSGFQYIKYAKIYAFNYHKHVFHAVSLN